MTTRDVVRKMEVIRQVAIEAINKGRCEKQDLNFQAYKYENVGLYQLGLDSPHWFRYKSCCYTKYSNIITFEIDYPIDSEELNPIKDIHSFIKELNRIFNIDNND